MQLKPEELIKEIENTYSKDLVSKNSEIAMLKAVNTKLQAENDELKSENDKLKKEGK